MSQVQKFIATLPDPIVPVTVTADVQVANGEVRTFTGTFNVRRMPFIEVDKLNAHVLDASGKFDPDKAAGHRARLIATCVTEGEGDDMRKLTEYEVGQWPSEIVLALAKEVSRINGTDAKAKENASKNSETAPGSGG